MCSVARLDFLLLLNQFWFWMRYKPVKEQFSHRDDVEHVLDVALAAELELEEPRHVLHLLGLVRQVLHVAADVLDHGLRKKRYGF